MLEEHVERFNAGVRSGDFGPMVAAFAEDAELVFEGYPVGPFSGRDAVAMRTARNRRTTRSFCSMVTGGAGQKEPEAPAGGIFLSEREGEIARLAIRYDR